MKKQIYFYLLIVVVLIIIGMIFGARLAGLIGAITGGIALKNQKDRAKKEAEQAEQNYEDIKKENDKEIAEAGEDINAKEYNNADDARDGINDFIDGDG